MNSQAADIFPSEVPSMDQISNYFTVTGLQVSAFSFPVALSLLSEQGFLREEL